MIFPTSLHIEYPLSWEIGVFAFQTLLPFVLAYLCFRFIPLKGWRVLTAFLVLGAGYWFYWLNLLTILASYLLIGVLLWQDVILYQKEKA